MDKKFFDLDAKVVALNERLMRMGSGRRAAFLDDYNHKLDVSLLYHDNALEGVVLQYSEIKAAIDTRIISDVSLIPMYEEIKNQKAAFLFARDWASNKKKAPLTLETIKKVYSILCPHEGAKGAPYRKDNPLHRAYYHEISAPDKIVARMKKLVEWLAEDETRRLHAVERAARFHQRLMAIYPWTRSAGKLARVLSNMLLLRDGYLPAVIHAIDRQRYYEVLRSETAGIVPLTAESAGASLESALRALHEFDEQIRSRAAS